MKRRKFGASLLCLSYALTISTLFISPDAESRVGGGRSFGGRGSRGFSAPGGGGYNRGYSSNPSQSRSGQTQYGNSNPYAGRPQQAPSTGSSFLKSMGAGIAGGFLGNMLFRSLGGGGMGGGYGMGGVGGMGGGGGFGVIEFLLLLGLIFVLFKIFARKPLQSTGLMNREEGRDEAANLMRDARPNGWLGNTSSSGDNYRQESQTDNFSEGTPIDRDQAMDLFFQVQGAWANRDLSSAAGLLDVEAKTFLEEELYRLKSLKQINRLENIAVRDVQAIESWRDMNKEFSTVKITANLLDFTVDESSLQIVSGSKTTPVKFEEYWTFARENGSPWKLSAIQQS
ncbi:MAG: TIM44-like domain-containing protein [Bdellovibrionia bacterium]